MVRGPTELTIACTAYRWDAGSSSKECEQGVVPIGEPFLGMDALIVDDELREVPIGAAGEPLMTGPQLTLGYWDDEEKTRRAYVVYKDLFSRDSFEKKEKSPRKTHKNKIDI